MISKERLRARYLRDPLPVRLGELPSTFGRISSSARLALAPSNVKDALEEAKYFIEWTAADTEPEIAAELVSMQTLLNLWLKPGTKPVRTKDIADLENLS